tara:strand:- start:175 stop:762 length:588 start_codon:yes stop_codon:yes gene_type:complete
MRYLLLILILLLLGCTNQYSVRGDRSYWYTRDGERIWNGFQSSSKFESDNYVSDSKYDRFSRFYLDLVVSKFKFIGNNPEFVFLKYRYVYHDWIFINQYKGIQIFLTNGEVIKLSLDEPPSTKMESRYYSNSQIYVHEYGTISIDKQSLKKILAHPIQSIKIKGRYDSIDYTERVDVLWNNWKEFSDVHLVEFLK